jgi:hypothetical protein
MVDNSSIRLNTEKNVLVTTNRNVPVAEVDHIRCVRKYISKKMIEELAVEKYKSNGNGITFEDIEIRFMLKKSKAQRSLKHFHERGILFTAQDLLRQGVNLIPNRNPQQYFPSYMKADIIEVFKKKKSVLVDLTGVDHSNSSTAPLLSSSLSSRHLLLSNDIQYQKAQNFLDVIMFIPFQPPYIHKLQLQLFVDKEYFPTIGREEVRGNRAKMHAERMARGDITFLVYPSGKVVVTVACSNNPFKIETDEDLAILFSFLGQVRDRLMYFLDDPRELTVPQLLSWILSQCDFNKDIEITDKAQITLPDIQLKYANKVFRMYVKSLGNKAVCREEHALKLGLPLIEALDNIRHPHKSLQEQIDRLNANIEHLAKRFDSLKVQDPIHAT